MLEHLNNSIANIKILTVMARKQMNEQMCIIKRHNTNLMVADFKQGMPIMTTELKQARLFNEHTAKSMLNHLAVIDSEYTYYKHQNLIIMKSNNIFRASMLKADKRFKDILPAIETEDFIHVCIINDLVKDAYFVISYVWDTREILRSGLHYTGDACGDSIKALMNLEDDDKASLLADDNLTFLRVNDAQTLEFIDYVNFANSDIMIVPALARLTSNTEDTGAVRTKVWSLNGQPICTMTKARTSEGFVLDTTQNLHNINQFFGAQVMDVSMNVFGSNEHKWLSRDAVKAKLDMIANAAGVKISWNK